MRPFIVLCAFAALAACGSAEADKGKEAGPQPNGTATSGRIVTGKFDSSFAGTPAPAVPFEVDASGKTATLAAYKGKRVLVNLWATWCAPCIKEMPLLDKVAARAGNKLVVLPVSQDMEGWRAVSPFFTKARYPNLTTVVDSQMAFGAAVKAKGLPVTILYDEQGKEVWRVNGDFDWAGAEAAAKLGV